MSIRAVIFDLGGVLVRTGDHSPRHELAARLGISYERLMQAVFESQSARLATVGELDDDAHWAAVCQELGVPLAELAPFKDSFWGGDAIDFELLDWLRSLRPRYKTGLLSNAWPNLRKVLTHHWGIIDAFDEVVISGEEKIAKPDPRIYAIMVGRLGVRPEEAVFVDDVARNVEAARAAGLQGVQFVNPEQVRADLEKLLDEH